MKIPTPTEGKVKKSIPPIIPSSPGTYAPGGPRARSRSQFPQQSCLPPPSPGGGGEGGGALMPETKLDRCY